MKTFLFAIALAPVAIALTPAAQAHQVDELPNYKGNNPINFHHYAGHIDLPSNGQKMFYWHVESQHSPENDPLVLWLNGGPGCSSLGGFFTEIGPFVVQRDLSVKLNQYTWARKTNLVFLESPAGVGFSQPVLNATDYNDEFTSDRAFEFLEQFTKAYPQFKNRDFYITGESYAGIYIPFLVEKMLQTPTTGLNLKGYAIGNPFTDAKIDGNAYVDYYYTHALISMESYNDIVDKCSDELSGCLFSTTNCSKPCHEAVVDSPITSDTPYLNPYYIYGDVCVLANGQGNLLHLRPNLQPMHRGNIGPCTDRFTQDYLNLPQVKSAIHVEGKLTWTDCNSMIAERYNRTSSALPKYKGNLQTNVSALIYSGDADAVVNFIGTERWIGSTEGLGLKVKSKWSPWYGPDKQLAGYSQTYAGLTFKTVKGAGHMVPAIRPLHALYMFECFVYGQDACDSFKYPKDNLEYLTGAEQDEESNTQKSTTSHSEYITTQPNVFWCIALGAISGLMSFLLLQIVWRRYERTKYHDLSKKMEAHRIY
ncbi:serine protease family S10 [Thraustotheca clavata]|uniref:Carboxypeptidase n=1 Tax=Thraustotheca clavata TaxID=74557 RepID=A0A1V9ZXI9_9STRA|nr:serine protease family S10 [Thraustotheca clavata]